MIGFAIVHGMMVGLSLFPEQVATREPPTGTAGELGNVRIPLEG